MAVMASEQDDEHLQHLLNEQSATLTPIPTLTQTSPSKFYSYFFYKSFFIAALVLVLYLLPSQPPESVEKSILTKNWELLYVLIVGIAVSYGLLSRKVDMENEMNDTHLVKMSGDGVNNAENYVSRILHVSSFFEDDVEDLDRNDDPKVETWRSRYCIGDPEVLVANESDGSVGSGSGRRLLLPVRSLRSNVSINEEEEGVVGDDMDEEEELEYAKLLSLQSMSKSSSGTRSVVSGSFRMAESGDSGSLNFNELDMEEKFKGNVVHKSPIPWRTRSGKFEVKEEIGGDSSPRYYVPPKDVKESRVDRVEMRSSQSFGSNLASPSSKKLSLSPSLLQEMRTKDVEDSRRMPSILQEMTAKDVEDFRTRKSIHSYSPPPLAPTTPPPPPPPPLPTLFNRKPPLASSSSMNTNREVLYEKNGNLKDEMKNPRKDSSRQDSPMRKSLRTFRAHEPSPSRSEFDSNAEKLRPLEVVKPQKTVEFEQPLNKARKPGMESPKLSPRPQFPKYNNEEKKEYVEKVVVESEYNSDSEADEISELSEDEKTTPTRTAVGNNATEPDAFEVDKKADEFIAKFREQIRLQRIDSLRRSSGKHTRNISR